jgi:hypothetical protein
MDQGAAGRNDRFAQADSAAKFDHGREAEQRRCIGTFAYLDNQAGFCVFL